MSPSAQPTLEKLTETIENKHKTSQGSREVQVQGDGEEALNPDNTSSVMSTVLNTINNAFNYECLDETVRLLNAHPIG